MIDFGDQPDDDGTPDNDGIEDQTNGSHRPSIMAGDFNEIGISSKPRWDAGHTTEDQEFGRRFSTHVVPTGAVYRDLGGNGFYTAGEGVAAATITATPVGGGAKQATTYSSGGYALELNTPGNYSVAVSGAFATVNLGIIAIATQNVLRGVVVRGSNTPSDFTGDGKTDYFIFNGAPASRGFGTSMARPMSVGPSARPCRRLGCWAGRQTSTGTASLTLSSTTQAPAKRGSVTLNGAAYVSGAYGPTLPAGWEVVAP